MVSERTRRRMELIRKIRTVKAPMGRRIKITKDVKSGRIRGVWKHGKFFAPKSFGTVKGLKNAKAKLRWRNRTWIRY